MTIKATLAAIKAENMAGSWDAAVSEYRVTFPASEMNAERREACASYTGDAADAIGTARTMRQHLDGLTPDQRAAVIRGKTL